MPSISDAVVGNALAWSQVADTLAQTEQRKALAADQTSLAQQRLTNVMMMQDKMAQDKKAAELAATTPLPGAGSLPAAQENPMDVLKATAADQYKSMLRSRQMVEVYKQNRMFDKAVDAEKDSHRISQDLFNTQQAIRRQQVEDVRETGAIASSVTDEGSFNLAYPMLLAMNPAFSKAPVDRDFDGQPIWGPTTSKTIKGISEMSRTAQQKADEELKVAGLEIKQQRAQIASEKAEADIAKANARVAESDSIIAKNQAGAAEKTAHASLMGAREEAILSPKEVKKAKETALKPVTGQAVKNAMEAVQSTPGFDDPSVKFPNMRGFATDVADMANKIVAQDFAKGERTSYGEAYEQAIATLKPFVKETTTGMFFKDKVLTYQRPALKNLKEAMPEGELKGILEKAKIPFEPDKYTYRVTPSGEVQRKAK